MSHIWDIFSFMGQTIISADQKLADRLKDLRNDHGWSLDSLAKRSRVSRATLSRIENAEVSPTAAVLGKLCAVYGMTVSRLLHSVEDDFVPLSPRNEQREWRDPKTGFSRRNVSPPAETLAGEVLECRLDPGATVSYDAPPRPGMEHHLLLLEGQLRVLIERETYDLQPGDCLRYQLYGPSAFHTPAGSEARYLLFILN